MKQQARPQPATPRPAPRRPALGSPAIAWTESFRDPSAEWLEADGFGGYASGCAGLVRTRRYHALLLAAVSPPTGRQCLVNDVEVAIETAAGRVALSTHRYAGDVLYPDGASRLTGYANEPWPHWRFRLEDGSEIEYEVFTAHANAGVVLRWTLRGDVGAARLLVRPLLSGRDAHALMLENAAFRFDAEVDGGRVAWMPYPGLPTIAAYTNGEYTHAPDWYRRFLYSEERARGLENLEDLAAPGTFAFDLKRSPAAIVLAAEGASLEGAAFERVRDAARRSGVRRSTGILAAVKALAGAETKRRAKFASPLHRAADAYLVRRGDGLTVIAGYPWFTDWGRDTFIALRGLCLAGDRVDAAGSILGEWAGLVAEGLMPNRFVDGGGHAEYNSVDASLWYVIAAAEYLESMARGGRRVTNAARAALQGAVRAILEGYTRGTRHGIRLDSDGLIACGEPGSQLTWMDAKVGDWVVTPRVGKPVEIQALWLNALRMAGGFDDRWEDTLERGVRSFRERFWNATTRALYDVVDVDHVPGRVDGSIRPNMLFAIGGLPFSVIDGPRARAIVDVAEAQLWTPLGPRSLSPADPAYRPAYAGAPLERDGAYHQGTVWPWLAGPFVEAWVRVRGGSPEAKREARERFITPLLRHLDEAGLGHVSEVADAEPPHTPKGCPFQAWSVGELLRLVENVLSDPPTHGSAARAAGGTSELRVDTLAGISVASRTT